jgi:type IV pilus assembly protein PilC
MGNSQYKDAIQDVIDGIQVGQPIAGTLLKHSAFIPMDVIMLLRVGEETASFDRALENAIRMYEDEFQKSLDGLSKLLEPILIVFV